MTLQQFNQQYPHLNWTNQTITNINVNRTISEANALEVTITYAPRPENYVYVQTQQTSCVPATSIGFINGYIVFNVGTGYFLRTYNN